MTAEESYENGYAAYFLCAGHVPMARVPEAAEAKEWWAGWHDAAAEDE